MSIISPFSLKGPASVAHGWMFIGFTINVLLLGTMITQVYLYYTTYGKDKQWIKVFVAVLFFADIMNTMFDFCYLYRCLIIFFGDSDYLTKADWLFATDPALTGFIASSVQLFFAWRVLILTKTKVWSVAIGTFAIAGGVSAIITSFEVGKTPRFVDFRNFKATVIVWLAAEALGDVMITTVLRKHKTGFQRSDMMVDRIIRITVQTGLVTMIFASLDLLFFLIDPTGTHLLFNFPLCKLYSNSLMSSLNSRRGWKYNGTTTGESEGQIVSTGNPKLARNTVNLKGTDSRAYPEVFVHVESHELREVHQSPTTDKQYDEKSRPLDSDSSVDRTHEKWTGDKTWSGA